MTEASNPPLPGRPLPQNRFSDALRYGLAILSVALATGAAILAQRFHVRDIEVPLFLFALALTAWAAGARPAMLALALSLVSFDYFFVEPTYSLNMTSSDLPYFFIFGAFALLVTWFGTIRRRAEGDLRQARDRLEIEVAPPTMYSKPNGRELCRRCEEPSGRPPREANSDSRKTHSGAAKPIWPKPRD
jgi:Domain of unknown function (DUF4118)